MFQPAEFLSTCIAPACPGGTLTGYWDSAAALRLHCHRLATRLRFFSTYFFFLSRPSASPCDQAAFNFSPPSLLSRASSFCTSLTLLASAPGLQLQTQTQSLPLPLPLSLSIVLLVKKLSLSPHCVGGQSYVLVTVGPVPSVTSDFS